MRICRVDLEGIDLMKLLNLTSHPATFSITSTPPHEVAWQNLHHAGPVLALPRARDLMEVDRARKGECEPLSLILQRGEAARAYRDTILLDLDGAGNQLSYALPSIACSSLSHTAG